MQSLINTLINIDSFDDLVAISEKFCKKFDFPINPDSLEAKVVKEFEYIKINFPDINRLTDELNKNLFDLGLYTNRNKYLFGWMNYATKVTCFYSYSYGEKFVKYGNNDLSINQFSSYLKLLGLIFDILVDDLGDRYKSIGSADMLKSSLDIVSGKGYSNRLNLTLSELNYVNFTNKMWSYFNTVVIESNFANTHLKLRLINAFQLLVEACILCRKYDNALVKGDLIKAKLYCVEINESKLLDNKMHIVINTIIDLLVIDKYVQNISERDINLLIKISEILQSLGRLSNDLSTWKREVKSQDFTSIIARKLLFEKQIDKVDIEQLRIPEKVKGKINNEIMEVYKSNLVEIINLSKKLEDLPWLNLQETLERYIAGLLIHLNAEGKI